MDFLAVQDSSYHSVEVPEMTAHICQRRNDLSLPLGVASRERAFKVDRPGIVMAARLLNTMFSSPPNRSRNLDDQAELGLLIRHRERIAQEVAAETALWRETNVVERNVFLGIVEPLF